MNDKKWFELRGIVTNPILNFGNKERQEKIKKCYYKAINLINNCRRIQNQKMIKELSDILYNAVWVWDLSQKGNQEMLQDARKIFSKFWEAVHKLLNRLRCLAKKNQFEESFLEYVLYQGQIYRFVKVVQKEDLRFDGYFYSFSKTTELFEKERTQNTTEKKVFLIIENTDNDTAIDVPGIYNLYNKINNDNIQGYDESEVIFIMDKKYLIAINN